MARWFFTALLLIPGLVWAEPPAAPAPAAGNARGEVDTLARDPHSKSAAEFLGRARGAFTRADRLRASGDAVRAKLAESTAEAWVHAARSLVDVERRRSSTTTLEAKAHDAEQRLSRARATLEATFAREQSLEADAARRETETKNKSAPKDTKKKP